MDQDPSPTEVAAPNPDDDAVTTPSSDSTASMSSLSISPSSASSLSTASSRTDAPSAVTDSSSSNKTAPAKRRSGGIGRKYKGFRQGSLEQVANALSKRAKTMSITTNKKPVLPQDDPSCIDDKQRRQLISLFYISVSDAAPRPDWQGEGGTISQICRGLDMAGTNSNRELIHRVLVQTNMCIADGTSYTGELVLPRGHPVQLIEDGSKEQTLIANYSERGCSVTVCCIVINIYRFSNGLVPVSRSAVYNAMKRMRFREVPIELRSQGSLDKDSDWAQANKAQTGQLLLRVGKATDLDFSCYKVDGVLPPGFDPAALEGMPIHEGAVVWWDEAHQDCRTHELGVGDVNVQYPRNNKGVYDENGTYGTAAIKLTHKYEGQFRGGFGIAKIWKDGEWVGVRLPLFDYSGKTLMTEKNMEDKRFQAIRHLKDKNKRDNAKWTENARPVGVYYLSDALSTVKGIGPMKANAFADCGITTVAQLRVLVGNDELINAAIKSVRGCGPAMMKKIIDETSNVLTSAPPNTVYHLDSSNPYESKFGPDWRKEIDETKEMSPYRSVRDMVRHMYNVSKELYVGTEHEDSWLFYHDALKLMTATGTIDWMKEEGIYKHWIKPEFGICDEWRYYKHHMVGNQPEKMPLDNSCNKDIKSSVDRSITLSNALCKDKNDPRVFSIATPNHASRAFKRIFDPVTGVSPTSERIIQDIDRVWVNMRTIYENDGAHVPGLASRTGHRKSSGRNGFKWGGKREKKAAEHFFLGGEDGEWMWKAGGLGDLHGDIKDLFQSHDILKASEDLFEEKIAVTEARAASAGGSN